ncbi:hypothetical protein DAI22_01g138366 [Oryza sativa Japonica Group]|nr:hypothetical protein DAI22_01g138366 [Oryza sativa Japonica Group]
MISFHVPSRHQSLMASIKLKFVQILDPLSPRREKKNLDYRYYGF